MPKVSMSARLAVPADTVWRTIGGFNALPDWHPAVEKSEIEGEGGATGTLRRLSLLGGGELVERLETLDKDARRYGYSIVQGPLPVANYQATIRVTEDADGRACTVEWSSDFDAEGGPEANAIAAIEGIYKAGLDNLMKMFGTGDKS